MQRIQSAATQSGLTPVLDHGECDGDSRYMSRFPSTIMKKSAQAISIHHGVCTARRSPNLYRSSQPRLRSCPLAVKNLSAFFAMATSLDSKLSTIQPSPGFH